MNTSRLARTIAILLAASLVASGAVLAERDKRERRPRDEARYEQPRELPAPTFQHRSTRQWAPERERRDDYRDHLPRQSQGRFYDDRTRAPGYDRRRGQRPVNDVIREVQDRYGGQVIGVQQSNGDTYRVRVLQRDGRVRNVLVPAE
jgi:hypothetical protein